MIFEDNYCDYETALELNELGTPKLSYVGSIYYNKDDKKTLYMYLYDNEILASMVNISNYNEGYSVNALPIKDLIRAYNSAELGLMIPVDYTLPVKSIEGWGFVDNEGNILTDEFYKTEAQARAKYLAFFLKHKILEPKK